ncbi:hypothetical protein QG516_25030 [Pedobacter gandavensis]|uniref:hypothetical protein n=1 Tax=Pedobacter TaxID=84567 RepID=UPI001C98EDD9|nr:MULTISPECIES: hypothetical protein [Pedobacter]WGQ09782.1 hypothetical protein QG516_25030 [Pedobacter gandavensis]
MNNIRLGELKTVFDDLEEIFYQMQIDFYLIGALAKEVWYTGSGQLQRTTKDVDFAVFIASKKDYEDVKTYLIETKNYSESKNNAFIMISPDGMEIDMLPFGGMEIDDDVNFEGTGLTNIKVNGFMEVHQSGTAIVDLDTGHSFRIATLPAIVLLKFISYDDRPENRGKDPRDIINIVLHFFNLQSDLIYDHHSDLFGGEEDVELEQIAAKVIGREIRKIIAGNDELLQRIISILQVQLKQKEKSGLIRNMVNESERNVDYVLQLLVYLLKGVTEA